MLGRYRRASRLTAPKAAVETPDIAADGYWIDEERFFFIDERFSASDGRVVAAPSIVNARTREITQIISVAEVDRLVSDGSNEAVEADVAAGAQFDMPNRDRLAVSIGGRNYLLDANTGGILHSTQSMDVAALYSPDGRFAAYVRGHDLWLRDRVTGADRALTTDGEAHFCYGQESEACLWPLAYRENPYPAAVWSPDSQWLLTHRIDERAVPELALVQHAPPGGGRPLLHRYKYPVPGDPLPVATFVAIHVTSNRAVSFDSFPAMVAAFSPFFMRLAWFSCADVAWFVRTDRHCRHAELVRLDLGQGTARVVLSEHAEDGYLEPNTQLGGLPNVRVLQATHEIVWFSQRSGSGHLYLYDAETGELKNSITRGTYRVRDIVHIDESQRRLFFLAAGCNPSVDPARRSLCAVNLDGSGFTVLRSHDGDLSMSRNERCGLGQDRPHRPADASVGISPDARFGVLRYLSVADGDRVDIIDLRENHDFTLGAALASEDRTARPFMALADDGETRLFGVMFLPPDFKADEQYALIDYIYPGPQKAQQPQSQRASTASQAVTLAELGFVTIMLDTRGTPVGARAFHQAGYGALLEPQLADHAAVVRQLCDRHPFIDRTRIGMLGWSGGGYATARALCDYADLYKVGVAVCGDHDPHHYAAFWSEKYRGPGDAKAFAHQSSGAVAHKLRGRLLLITGDMDDNVHPAHTLSLVDSLIRANKDFDLLVVPNENHYVLTTSGYAQRRVWDFFVTHLMGEVPPREFELTFSSREIARFHKRFWRELRQ